LFLVDVLLRPLLSCNLVLEICNFLLLDTLESEGVVTRLFNLSHKLLLLLGQIAHAALHFLLVILRLLVLLAGDALGAV